MPGFRARLAVAARDQRRAKLMNDTKMDLDKIATGVRLILEGMGEDMRRSGIQDTPKRVAEMYAEICGGLHEDPQAEMKVIPAETQEELVLVRDIAFASICEHHLVPFTGVAHIAYIPAEGRIIGLSKLARITEVQERLTTQIADWLYAGELKPKGVMVVMEASHLCMVMRGIKKHGATTLTSAVRGMFESHPTTRQEALSLINSPKRSL
jgi:GTP cyclohydrolase I